MIITTSVHTLRFICFVNISIQRYASLTAFSKPRFSSKYVWQFSTPGSSISSVFSISKLLIEGKEKTKIYSTSKNGQRIRFL